MMPSFLLRDPNSTRFLLEQDEIDMTPKRPKQTIAIPTLYPPLLYDQLPNCLMEFQSLF